MLQCLSKNVQNLFSSISRHSGFPTFDNNLTGKKEDLSSQHLNLRDLTFSLFQFERLMPGFGQRDWRAKDKTGYFFPLHLRATSTSVAEHRNRAIGPRPTMAWIFEFCPETPILFKMLGILFLFWFEVGLKIVSGFKIMVIYNLFELFLHVSKSQ